MIDPAKLTPREALQLAIGRYVISFSNLDSVVTVHISYVLELDYKLTFFILKDVFFDQKVKLLRRSVAQKFGEKKSEAYRSALTGVTKAGEFRNSLLHGAFAQDGLKQLRGKLGQSLTVFDEGLKEVDGAAIDAESRRLSELAGALIGHFSTLSPSSSSSREQSGSGDQ